MPNRAIHTDIKVVKMLTPIVVNNDTEAAPATPLDCKGYDAAEAILSVGVTGDTLSGSVKVEVKAQESDNGTDWTACAAADVDVSSNATASAVTAPDANGIICTIDDNAEDDVVVRAGYKGSKRYYRLFPDMTGTHTNGIPMSMIGILALGAQLPVQD